MDAAWIALLFLEHLGFVDYRKANHIFTRGNLLPDHSYRCGGFNSFYIFCFWNSNEERRSSFRRRRLSL